MSGIVAYVLRSYPPVLSVSYAAAFAVGGVGLFAALDGGSLRGAAPVLGLAFVTLLLDLFVMRALDDIRDYDYDVVANPDRPLVAGAVTRRTVTLAAVVCAFGAVVVNVTFAPGLVVMGLQLAYAACLVTANLRWNRPSGDNLELSALASLPIQLLLYVYLFLAYREVEPTADSGIAAVGFAILLLGAVQVEFGKKLVRLPTPSERTYVKSLGHTATAVLTVAPAPVAFLVFAATADAGIGWRLVCGVPLAFVLVGAWQYWGARKSRWPQAMSALCLLGTLIAFGVVGFA